MAASKIIVTRDDHAQLERLLQDELLTAIAHPKTLEEFASELELAEIVDSGSVPGDVVTMNSIVKLTNLTSGESETYTLVFPDDANIAAGRLSILAPVGAAILGYRVGSRACWEVPAGTTNVRIDEIVFQPERDAITA